MEGKSESNSGKGSMGTIGLSVIIPVYNAEQWMQPTLEKLDAALALASFDAEVIVIDDGSTDKSAANARQVKLKSGAKLEVISQPNRGRYLARKTGVERATKDNILFLDSRVFVGERSLKYLSEQLADDSDQIWNGHVNIDKQGSMFTRFWDAIVCIAWRRYFRHPKQTQYGIKDFDYYPKGTGFFYVPKVRLRAAMDYFEKTTNDINHSSDDTLLIRYMNERQMINLSPQFDCLYHGRTNMKSFFKHAYHRGEFFIDGILRPGTRFFLPLLAVLGASVCIIPLLLLWPIYTVLFLSVAAVLLMFGLFIGALILGVELADAASLAILGVPFAGVYLGGLWRGVFRKLIKQREISI
jgi:glycosyltransferase involved in cell wall biosynthesis